MLSKDIPAGFGLPGTESQACSPIAIANRTPGTPGIAGTPAVSVEFRIRAEVESKVARHQPPPWGADSTVTGYFDRMSS